MGSVSFICFFFFFFEKTKNVGNSDGMGCRGRKLADQDLRDGSETRY